MHAFTNHACEFANVYLHAGNKSPLMKDGLSPDSQILCVCAYTKFRDVCTFLQTGEISISDLHKLADNKILADQLCAAVITTGDKDLTYESVMKSLSQRLNEYKFFCSRQKAYRQICEWIPYQEKVQGKVCLYIPVVNISLYYNCMQV